jgi:hypothetical protein
LGELAILFFVAIITHLFTNAIRNSLYFFIVGKVLVLIEAYVLLFKCVVQKLVVHTKIFYMAIIPILHTPREIMLILKKRDVIATWIIRV